MILQRVIGVLICIAPVFVVHSQVKIIAHRGASGEAPENTLASISLAIENGADFIEVDVRLSSDDSLMVIHDEEVDRTTSGSGKVKDLSWNELKKLDAGYPAKFGDDFSNLQIPTLFEVLQFVRNKVGLCIDLKSVDEMSVIDLIEKMDMEHRVVLLSYNPEKLQRAKSRNNEIGVVLIKNILSTPELLIASEIGAIAVAGGSPSPDYLISRAHDLKLELWKGIINNPAEMEELIHDGIDGILTNYPGLPDEITTNPLHLFPNPFSDRLTIEVNYPTTDYNIYVYNHLGRLICKLNDHIPNVFTWNPIHLTDGVYYIHFDSEKHSYLEKVILIRN